MHARFNTASSPFVRLFLRLLGLSQVREKLYRAFTTRASSTSVGEEGKSLDNEPHIARILELKKTMAGLLGYDSYAEVSLASKVRVFLCFSVSLISLPSNLYCLPQCNLVKAGHCAFRRHGRLSLLLSPQGNCGRFLLCRGVWRGAV